MEAVVKAKGEIGRSLRGNVDRNLMASGIVQGGTCRSLRGNVDRNGLHLTSLKRLARVVPYVGTWIEILLVRRW